MPANTPRLETERLVLRRFTPGGCGAAVFPLMRDREVNTFLPWFPAGDRGGRRRISGGHYLDYYRRPSGCRFAVCLRENDRPIGYLPADDGRAMIRATPWPAILGPRRYMTEAAAA